MSLLSRLFKSKSASVGPAPHENQIEAVGLLLLAAREKRDDSLRDSALLGELLGLLWREDAQALKAVHAAFSSVAKLNREYVETLARRLRALQPTPPPTPEGRYEAVVDVLRAELDRYSGACRRTNFALRRHTTMYQYVDPGTHPPPA